MNDLISVLGAQLYKTFFFNNQAYAIQERINGEVKFFTKHYRIDANKISYYIGQKKSILSYQQRFDKLKWICLDFDVLKSAIINVNNFDFLTDSTYRPMLIEEVKIACSFLASNNIKYILEYSGNRGIHIWILFNEEITKKIGYTIIEEIVKKIPFKYINNINPSIGIDLFPKVPDAKNNKVGKGVKIPLSYHLKSNQYSYLLGKNIEINGVEELTNEFLKEQINLLNNIEYNNVLEVLEVLNIKQISEFKLYDKVICCFKDNIDASKVIEMLMKSDLYKHLLNKEVSLLNEEERKILVGTFVRLETETDSKFGVKVLKQIFSHDDNYDEALTEMKINLLINLYPPSISHLERILKLKCNYCLENKIENAIDLLEGITIRKIDDLLATIVWAKNSERNYLLSNDEVPLNFIIDELNNINASKIKNQVEEILVNGTYSKPIYYEYMRPENEDKVRRLYSLSGVDRVITTTLMKYIHDIIGFDNISPMSHSYRINAKPNYHIFDNWNLLWLDFMKAIHSCTDHPAYGKYYVIKMDIKSFYDDINLTLLKEIIHSKAGNEINNKLIELTMSKLDEESKNKFKNAANYLIKTCGEFGDKGVPQGPAFARYLAEIYLSSIDNYLYGKLDWMFDYACRYVDDYYIFIKDVEKGVEIKNSIQSELAKIHLELNSKFKYGILDDIKHEIVTKNQIEKYFIDGIDHSTSENIKERAIVLLNNMFKDVESEENIKNIPFFLTHLFDDDFLKRISPTLIEKVALLEVGRGSLFKHFYNNVAMKYSKLEFYKKISGLSRANFITSISNNYQKSNIDLIELINFYLSNTLVLHERRELLRLVLLSGSEVDLSFITENDYSIMLELLEFIEYVNWNQPILKIILDKIQDIDDKRKTLELIEKLLSKSRNMPENRLLVDIVYSTVYQNYESFKDTIDSQIIFNLIAYCTLYMGSEQHVVLLWTKLLLLTEGKRIEENLWYKYSTLINQNAINQNTVISFLVTSFRENSKIAGCAVKEHEQNYSLYLFLYLNNIDYMKDKIKEDLCDLVKSVAEEKNIEFLSWCCNDAKYFLEADISIKNIEVNDRVVLKKGEQILVRGSRDMFDPSDEIVEEKWGTGISKYYSIYGLDSVPADFDKKIKEKDLFEIFIFSYRIIKELKAKKLVNIFERGSLSESNDDIYLQYSHKDNWFIVDNENKIKCDIDAIIDTMIEKIKTTNLKTVQLQPNISLNSNALFTQIIPVSLLKNNKKARNHYFVEICKSIYEIFEKEKLKVINIYKFEEVKINALSSCIEYFDSRFPATIKVLSNNLQTLYLYNGMYEERYNDYLLYSKCNLKIDSLLDMINTFNNSISKNLDFDFIIEIQKEMKAQIERFKEKIGDLSNFKKVQVKVSNKYKKFEIDGIVRNPSTLEFVIFDGQYEKFELSEQELLSINDDDYLYMFNNILVKLPDLYHKGFEIIKNKDDSRDLEKYIEGLSIKSEYFYNPAVDVIVKQSGNSIDPIIAAGRISKLLNGTNQKYHNEVLEVISKHRPFEIAELEEFIDLIKTSLSDHNTNLIPLKNFEVDKNGLYVIIRESDYKTNFQRNSDYDDKLKAHINNFHQGVPKDNIVFVSDIGIGGSQVKNVFDYHLKITNKTYPKETHYKYNSTRLKENIANSKTITFLNCVYTDIYEKKVKEYLIETFNYDNASIIFKGKKIENPLDFSFFNLHESTRTRFIEFVYECKSEFLDRKVFRNLSYREYLELCQSGENVDEGEMTKALMLLRLQSLPKYHHLLFREGIFNYRKDK